LPESIYVRGGPGDNFVAVGALSEGDEVFPLNLSDDGFWVLIPYGRGFGWVQRSLIVWEDLAALNALPVLAAGVTPTRAGPATATAFFPTSTPEGNYVDIVGAQSAYVRAGPGRGYLRMGQVLPGQQVEPVSRNADTTWLLIRYEDEFTDGFAWVARPLVNWEDEAALNDLPVVAEDDLTPTVTYTPGITPSVTATSTGTLTPTATATATNTATVTSTTTATFTPLPTETHTATATQTATSTATETATSSATPTATATATHTATATATVTDTATSPPTATATITPSDTPTSTPTHTLTATATVTATHTASATPTNTATPTLTPRPATIAAVVVTDVNPTATLEPLPSRTPTATDDPTAVAAAVTGAPEAGVRLPETATPLPETLTDETANTDETGGLPLEALLGGGLLLLILLYAGLYLRGLSAVNRYEDGFVIERCPVCGRGTLHLDEKPGRQMGIPTVRRTVRCDECRSVLRETAPHQWRYAVDRLENPELYSQLNNRRLSDDDLKKLSQAAAAPEFEDDEDTI
jgi:uncharacterized protein YgiM (DUF1202 family)